MTFQRIFVLFFLIFLNPYIVNAETPSIAIGDFKLSGSAESGQYAPHLVKLKRVIRDEFIKVSNWNISEKEGVEEPLQPSSFQGADYFLVGEMDGFDFSVNNRSKPSGETAGKLFRRSWIVRTRVSMRLISAAGGKLAD